MKKIESFNSGLNKTSNNDSKSMNRFREITNNLLIETCKLAPKNDIALVVGAGNLNDFSLTVFTDNFKETVLSDIDLESVSSSLSKLKKDGDFKGRVSLIRIEYTGFEINLFFSRFKEDILKLKEFKDIENYLKSKLDSLKNYRFLKEYQMNIDLIYVSPIYTQLVFNQVLYECAILRSSGYPEHNLKFIEDYMLEEMPYVINRFNNNLVNALKKDGVLVVVSDIFVADKLSNFYKKIHHSIDDYSLMEEIYQSYAEEFGIGLGDFGLINLNEKLEVLSSKWAIWPFDDKSSYIVKIQTYKK